MQMKKIISLTLGVLCAVTLIFTGCNNKKADTAKEPVVVAIDTNNLDKSVNPGDNFFLYSNGAWMKNNPIPAEQSRWGSFNILDEDLKKNLREIVENAAKESGAKGTPKQQIGDFFTSGMDTNTIEKLGYDPIKPELEMINKITNKAEWYAAVNALQANTVGPLFSFWGSQDDMNSSQVIAQFGQGGIGLGNRDYYLEKDKRSEDLRKAYVLHIGNMLKLIGAADAEKKSAAIMAFETELAKISMTNVEQRDPHKCYNKMTPEEFKKKFAYINWDNYFKAWDIPFPKEINVTSMPFFNGLGKVIEKTDVATLKDYLTWCVVNDAASLLSSNFVNTSFDFYGKVFSGKQKIDERWKRVLGVVSGSLDEPLGQLYVQKYFPPEAKERMLELVGNIRKALGNRIKNLDWMSQETKAKALEKLEAIRVKIGYPDKWEDYSSIVISKNSYFQNCLNASKYAYKKMLSEIDKPYDNEKWHMSPQTVNAYYSPNSNEIVFPAGILQPPFFYKDGDDAVNYGAIGVVIGHEITHGFDDQGCQFDKNGNLSNWWTKEDSEKFNAKAKKFGEEFARYTYPQLENAAINPELTMGENIADLGGVTISYEALQMALKAKPQNKLIDGFTQAQRFFLAYSQVWRQNVRDEELSKRLKDDPHSPGDARVNVIVPNHPAFYEAFGVKEGNKMYLKPEERIMIW